MTIIKLQGDLKLIFDPIQLGTVSLLHLLAARPNYFLLIVPVSSVAVLFVKRDPFSLLYDLLLCKYCRSLSHFQFFLDLLVVPNLMNSAVIVTILRIAS